MRNYFHWDHYLMELEKDTYYQPQKGDDHLVWATNVIDQWVAPLGVADVLDVGCGVGFCQPIFEKYGIVYEGITTDSRDLVDGKNAGRNIWGEDFNFIHANGDHYDLVFSRHSLEHSPAPLLTLMEWHRVAKKHLILVVPNPGYWGWAGRNHYAVAPLEQIKFWLDRAGWAFVKEHIDEKEFWFHAQKIDRRIPYYED
jgi:SAM-dependent methyltransferase